MSPPARMICANSLVGANGNDLVGSSCITLLANGNYVVNSPNWDNGEVVDVGAVTWGSGTVGVSGLISAVNSLVGTTARDFVGAFGIVTNSGFFGGHGKVVALSNGNYVVSSAQWDNDTATDAGAVTWGNGTIGTTGTVSAGNSLIGGTASDRVGGSDLTVLPNGNYVVKSPTWDHNTLVNAGAVTWCNGSTGVSGPIAAVNSLIGSTADERLGEGEVTVLDNGNFVVSNRRWANGAATMAGATTWGSGTTGVTGQITAANSLVGSTANDGVGFVISLNNGNYVVSSPSWDNGTVTNAGAVTWGNGTTGVAGHVTAANSLVGTVAGDQIGCCAYRSG